MHMLMFFLTTKFINNQVYVQDE